MAPENKTRLKPVSRSPHIATSHSQWTKTFKPIKTFGTCLVFFGFDHSHTVMMTKHMLTNLTD